MSRNTGAKILRENEAVTKAAMAFGAEKKIVTTQTIEVQGWPQQIPEVNGVFKALSALQVEEHTRASNLLVELSETTDGRRRGEIRRHYNTICKNIERNNQVLNALLDKKVGTPKKAKKPTKKTTKKATKAAKPKTQAKKKVTPEQVKKAASKRASGSSRGRRATLEKLSFKELQQWAKKRSFSAAGSKDEIINRILGNGK
ncbi:MAG: hypothetical protein CMA57_05155 [Euryarchaeota archaeon]|nr:hypothetical protein [Euryarchaeota archaeon]